MFDYVGNMSTGHEHDKIYQESIFGFRAISLPIFQQTEEIEVLYCRTLPEMDEKLTVSSSTWTLKSIDRNHKNALHFKAYSSIPKTFFAFISNTLNEVLTVVNI